MTTLRTPLSHPRFAAFLRLYQVALAVLAALMPLRVLGGDCASTHQGRADMLVFAALAVLTAVVLGGAALGDGDRHRAAGVAASAALTALVAGSSLVLPLAALLGALRVPRSRPMFILALVLAVTAVVVAWGLPLQAQRFVQPEQFVCP